MDDEYRLPSPAEKFSTSGDTLQPHSQDYRTSSESLLAFPRDSDIDESLIKRKKANQFIFCFFHGLVVLVIVSFSLWFLCNTKPSLLSIFSVGIFDISSLVSYFYGVAIRKTTEWREIENYMKFHYLSGSFLLLSSFFATFTQWPLKIMAFFLVKPLLTGGIFAVCYHGLFWRVYLGNYLKYVKQNCLVISHISMIENQICENISIK